MIVRKYKENNYIATYVEPILQVKHPEKGRILLFNGKNNTIATE